MDNAIGAVGVGARHPGMFSGEHRLHPGRLRAYPGYLRYDPNRQMPVHLLPHQDNYMMHTFTWRYLPALVPVEQVLQVEMTTEK